MKLIWSLFSNLRKVSISTWINYHVNQTKNPTAVYPGQVVFCISSQLVYCIDCLWSSVLLCADCWCHCQICPPIGQDWHQITKIRDFLKISFQYILARCAKMYWKLIFKKSQICPIWYQSVRFWPKSGTPGVIVHC